MKLGRGRRLPPEFGRGGEHQVYFHKRTQRYFKATLLERQLGYGIALGSLSRGATPSEYLDRLDLQNLIFHDYIRLERIIANNGQPIIITSQPFIKGVAATAAALDDLMLGKGYEKLTDGAYYSEREGLLVFDLSRVMPFWRRTDRFIPLTLSSSVSRRTSASFCANILTQST